MISTKTYYLLFILPLILIWASCSDKEKLSDSDQKMHFDVNSKLLSDSVYLSNYNLIFNPPKGWEPISKTLFDSLDQRIKEQPLSDTIKIIPLKVFVNNTSQCILNVSAVEAGSSSLENVINLFEQRESKKPGIGNFKRADFLKDNLRVTQFLIEENHLIIFKILIRLNKNKLIEFDYIVPKNSYSSEVKSFESSIGSIKLTNQ